MPVADTSFIVDLMRRDPGALARYQEYETQGIALQTTGISALELYKGAYLSGRSENLQKVAAILELFTVLPVDETVYESFGRLSAALAAGGTPIGDFDTVIAALALGGDGMIITRDGHFSNVPYLDVISY